MSTNWQLFQGPKKKYPTKCVGLVQSRRHQILSNILKICMYAAYMDLYILSIFDKILCTII
jgi:hypothetical protein